MNKKGVRTDVRTIELPLVQKLESILNLDLDFDFEGSSQAKKAVEFKTPKYIEENLKHKLRPYQEKALFNLNWTQQQKEADFDYKQLLFNMATGSGKTDVMAALILYLYAEHNYQNFLFVVNTNAVVAKTKENLLNEASAKYLFNAPIAINGERIEIKAVTRFPNNPETGVIYLRLTTVQTLTNELSSPRENGLTYDELKNQNLIILADEAHHFSASTKKKAENDAEKSWENVLTRLRQLNSKNRQFEFTATIDLQDENIYNKYARMIVYKYDLSSFIHEGYSKKVFRLQANNDDSNKMLNAILLSQYRKRIAKEFGVPDFKPVILFKSNKIAVSKESRDQFLNLVENLSVEKLHEFLVSQNKTSESQALKLAYEYWLEQDLASVVIELKRDFYSLNTINVNDNKEGILGDLNDLKNLNTLENVDNPFRVIFAVAKLSEGWDVLNLYDIVRIGEQPITANQTNSEAQLVGRGARYNPFIYNGEKSYTRGFDNQPYKQQLLENLHYHTINDPKYLENLKKSLDSLDLQVEDDTDFDVYTTKVKSKFKKSAAYKEGKLFYNLVEEVPAEEYDGLSKYGVKIAEVAEVDLTSTTYEASMDSSAESTTALTESRRVIKFSEDTPLVKKAMSRNTFYRFNKLREYIPTLKSIDEFITADQWLGKIRLNARVSRNADELTRHQQLKAVDQYLIYIQRQLVGNYNRQRGTNKFVSVPLQEVVKDYQKKVARVFNQRMHEIITPYDMKNQDWFVYDEAIVDGLERNFIEFVGGTFIDKLKEKYSNVYLIRNDEVANKFKLHQFTGTINNYAGFMPDFILYLENEDFIYQVYIEPKGSHLLEKDQWKEDLLESINPENVEIIGENDKVKLYGVRFYVSGDLRDIENELQEKGILPIEN